MTEQEDEFTDRARFLDRAECADRVSRDVPGIIALPDATKIMTTCSGSDQNKITAPPYDNYRRILLIGEADFSFTRAFAKAFSDGNSIHANNMEITATEYGNGIDISNRYYDGDVVSLSQSMNSLHKLAPVKEILSGLNARLLGNVDCTCHRWNIEKQKWDDPSQFWQESSKFDLIVFNFPHSDQAGRAEKLIKALFKQIQICIHDERLPKTIVLEMRLRFLETDPKLRKNIRAYYKHEEAAEESQFELVGCWESDLDRWEKLGYQHKWTRRNASCRDVGLACKVWRWTPR
jgi:hypothetical protein